MALAQETAEALHSPPVDVRRLVDESPFSIYQKLLLGLCFITTFVDGFDTQAVAVAGPMLRTEMGLGPAQLGTIFAAAMIGGIVAAFAMAPFADRVGRRPLLIAAVMASAVLSVGNGFVGTFGQLFAIRLGAGVFLAVAVTVAYTYAAEVAPKRAAATAVMIASAGFGLGVAATGFLSAWLIPHFGWRSIFYAGGAGAFALSLLLLCVLPESVRFMAQRDGHEFEIRKFLRRIDSRVALPPATRFFLNEERKTNVSLADVLGAGRSLVAIPLWISTFSLAFVVYVLMQWLPVFVTSGGGGPGRAGEAVGWFKLGGVVGGFICAACIERARNPYPILAAFLIPACATFVGMVMAPTGAGLFIASVAISGVLLNGPLYASNGLVGRLFPTYVRTGGLAITAGVGRMGAMAGPFSVGLLLQAGWSVPEVLEAAPIPLLVSVAFVSVLSLRERALVHSADAA
ncbi:MFS transporter [Paraburkholderia dipogonis]|uniref:MFS transporter n=1 Tax=Paraburkholderia dipogonis TaxID=1211383 RepID=UPI0038BBDC84